MNIITTTAPIGLEDLKKHFNDKSVSYVIDYANSKLKGKKLLTYISNLDLPIDISFDPNTEEGQELIKDYLESTFLVNVSSLEKAVIETLFVYRFEDSKNDFIKENKELLDLWARYLDSATLFNLYVVQEDTLKEFVKQQPEEKFDVIKGINFVHAFKYCDFFAFYQKIEPTNLKFMPQLFDEYIFKGKNLYSYWANENNPMFLITWGIASGELNVNEYLEAKEKTISEMGNVTPV